MFPPRACERRHLRVNAGRAGFPGWRREFLQVFREKVQQRGIK
jgi:hypothetical protein